MKLLRIVFITLILSSCLFSKEYIVNQKSNVQFQLSYQRTKTLDSYFDKVLGSIIYDENSNTIKSLKGKIEVSSIKTLNYDLNALIKSEKILNSKKFPNITFVATKIEKNRVFGDLKIKNVIRNVEFELINNGVFLDTLYLSMTATLKRGFFDLSWDELLDTGSSATSNEIKIKVDIEASLSNKNNFLTSYINTK